VIVEILTSTKPPNNTAIKCVGKRLTGPFTTDTLCSSGLSGELYSVIQMQLPPRHRQCTQSLTKKFL
jgi:hypothetical protein